MVTKQTDITDKLEACRIMTESPVVITETDDTYPIKTDVWDNWFTFAYLAFQELAKRQNVSSFAAVGTGNGVDAIGAIKTFGKSLDTVILTDISKPALEISEQNVRRYSAGKTVLAFEGSLCQPLIQRGLKVGSIYENLPNIPNSENITSGYKQASVFNPMTFSVKSSQKIRDYLLESHYALLAEAKYALNRNGSVICSIGGRVPNRLLKEIVKQLGYNYEEMVVGFKRQTEPGEVIPGYAKAEINGIEFDFYRYDEAVKFLESLGFERPFAAIGGDKLKEILAPYRISAKGALLLSEQNPGYAIGHTVHMVRAINQ